MLSAIDVPPGKSLPGESPSTIPARAAASSHAQPSGSSRRAVAIMSRIGGAVAGMIVVLTPIHAWPADQVGASPFDESLVESTNLTTGNNSSGDN